MRHSKATIIRMRKWVSWREAVDRADAKPAAAVAAYALHYCRIAENDRGNQDKIGPAAFWQFALALRVIHGDLPRSRRLAAILSPYTGAAYQRARLIRAC